MENRDAERPITPYSCYQKKEDRGDILEQARSTIRACRDPALLDTLPHSHADLEDTSHEMKTTAGTENPNPEPIALQ